MIRTTDDGLSMAVGFVMVLLVIAMIIGMWAVIGVPEQIRDAEDYHAIEVTNSFLDYKIAVDNQWKNDWDGSNISMLIPAASAYADGALFMEEDVGSLEIFNGVTSLGDYDVSRLYATFGTTNTLVGYECGGVFRNDYGSSVWVTPPSITLDPSDSTLNVTLVIPDIQGAFAVGSSEGIPVETELISVSPPENTLTSQVVTITYTADDEWDAQMWYTFFSETKIRYQLEGISITSTMPSSTQASMEITPPSGGINLTIITPVYDVDVRGY